MPKYVAAVYDYRERAVLLKREGSQEWDSIEHPHYFYLHGVPSPAVHELLDEFEMDGDWCRCYCRAASADRKVLINRLECAGFETYEGDVSPINRYLTDNDVQFGEPRVLWFDLETDGRAGWERLEDHRILTIGYTDSKGKRRCLVAKQGKHGEREMLEEFLFEVVDRHDLLAAWNGDAYDEPVIRARVERLGLGDRWSEHWQGVNFLDVMRLFQKYFNRDAKGEGVRTSFALDNIAKTVLGRGKEKKPMLTRDGRENPVQAIVDAWEDGAPELVEYNLRDVEIMVELEQKLGFLGFHRTLANLCGRFLSSVTLFSGYLNDAYVLRWGRKNGMRFRTKYTFYDDQLDVEKIEGAYVMDPVPGMHEGVCDLDFASLYPNVVRTFNISPEVKVRGGSGPLAFNGQRFSAKEEGAFPRIETEALNLRKRHKERAAQLEEEGKEESDEYRREKQMSDAYKLVCNALYGILASPKLRYYDPACGEAVTNSGKAIIQHVISIAASKGLPALYSDTDSLFLRCTREQALEFSKEMAAGVDAFLASRNARLGFIRMDLDVVYERVIFIKKKRYAGIKDTGVLDVKGLEYVRTDNCKTTRDLQRRIIEYLLMADRPTARKAVEIVGRFREETYGMRLRPEDIVLAQSLGKQLDEYKVDPPHVRIAKEMLAAGKEVYGGMKIPYVIVGTDAKGRQQVVHAADFRPPMHYDPDFYWLKKIFPATRAVLDAVFTSKEERELIASLSPKKARKSRAKKGGA